MYTWTYFIGAMFLTGERLLTYTEDNDNTKGTRELDSNHIDTCSLVVAVGALSPLTLSPSSFCLSGSTPVKVLMDCFRSITVSSSDRELMEYSWPPHFMITDTDMAHAGSSHTYTLTHTHALGCSWSWVCTSTDKCTHFQTNMSSYSNKHAHVHLAERGEQVK